jgi:predicted RNase H-like nuclease
MMVLNANRHNMEIEVRLAVVGRLGPPFNGALANRLDNVGANEVSTMTVVAGTDGCPAGWICIARDLRTGGIAASLYRCALDLINQQPSPKIVTVDIPIGLPNAGPRQCDREARARLGRPRSSSVFPAPIRPALGATNRAQASQITFAADGRRVGVQSWAIFPKIHEMDRALSGNPTLQTRVREVHPELCFWAWNNSSSMAHRKKSKQGKLDRKNLIDAYFGNRAMPVVRAQFARHDVGDDDIADAFAALWTAERIQAGGAHVIPAIPPQDANGLRIEIWY